MNYVFFDIECANCLNGEGKMCSFGYVLTDEKFRVIRKKDILMNPAAKFLLGNAKTGEGIKLAYPLYKFERQHTFPYYYNEIKNLLENPDNISFGFAVFQDVSYLSYTCRRYGLPIIRFSFFDIQKFEKLIHKRKDISGLDGLIEEYHLTSYTYHRSDDDALMTMEVFRSIVETHRLTVSTILEEYKTAYNDTDRLLAELEARKKQKIIKQQHIEKIHQFYEEPHHPFNMNLFNPKLYKKKFFIEYGLLYEEISFFMKDKENMESHGMVFTRNPMEADIALIYDHNHPPKLPSMKEDIQYMDFEELKTELKGKGH
jgi:DNA polymerase III epsilon subunit-like protein